MRVHYRKVSLKAGTTLWHMADRPVAFSNLRPSYLSPDVCQSALHPVTYPAGPFYLHEVLVTQDIPLLEIVRNRYPTLPTTKTLRRRTAADPAKPIKTARGGACLQATASSWRDFNQAATRAVCAFLQSHGANCTQDAEKTLRAKNK